MGEKKCMETGVGPGGRNQTLAVKSRKPTHKLIFCMQQYFISTVLDSVSDSDTSQSNYIDIDNPELNDRTKRVQGGEQHISLHLKSPA